MKITNTFGVGADALKIIVFGESGAGKTTLAGTIDEPTLIISAEAGLLPLRSKSIDVVDISTDDKGEIIPKEKRVARLGEVYQYLQTDEARKKYRWIFIDSLTEINQNLLEQLQSEFTDRKDTLVLYGELSKKMRSLVKSFRDLSGYNVVFTALAEVEKDDTGNRFTTISLVGSFASKISAFFDEVFFLHVEKNPETNEIIRKLVTEKSDRLTAKDRSGKLDRFEPANLSNIAKKIKQQKGESKK